MARQKNYQTPGLFLVICLLAFYFLSCTKKPDAQASAANAGTRAPASSDRNGMYTTLHGYKVQIEQVTVGSGKK